MYTRIDELKNTEKRVLKVISEIFCRPHSVHTRIDELGADSLDMVELIMSLEDEFRIEIPEEHEERFTEMTILQEIVTYVDAQLSTQQRRSNSRE
jgi:acyl carrier protein